MDCIFQKRNENFELAQQKEMKNAGGDESTAT
jgi:hypothetical protein